MHHGPYRGPVPELAGDVCDVVAEVAHGDAGHGPGRSGDAARLRPQDAVAGAGQGGGERVEVIAAVPAVGRQDHDAGPVAVHVGLDGHLAGGDDLTVPVHEFSFTGWSSARSSADLRMIPSGGGAVTPPSVVT
jgi:hypothetical protein